MLTRRQLLIAGLATLTMGCGQPQRTALPTTNLAPPCTEQWIHLPTQLRFPMGSTLIDAMNRQILRSLLPYMERSDVRRTRVEGHATSNETEPDALSLARARAVTDELALLGVPRETIDTVGFGSEQQTECSPLEVCANRRVEFTLLVCVSEVTVTERRTRRTAPLTTAERDALDERRCGRRVSVGWTRVASAYARSSRSTFRRGSTRSVRCASTARSPKRTARCAS